MTVIPTLFNADGSIAALCTNCEATTPVPPVQILHGVPGVDGAHLLTIDCSNCGSSTTHPIAGGAAARQVQELFIRVARRIGCPCGLVPAGRPLFLVQGHVKLLAERQDGVGRWQIVGTLT